MVDYRIVGSFMLAMGVTVCLDYGGRGGKQAATGPDGELKIDMDHPVLGSAFDGSGDITRYGGSSEADEPVGGGNFPILRTGYGKTGAAIDGGGDTGGTALEAEVDKGR